MRHHDRAARDGGYIGATIAIGMVAASLIAALETHPVWFAYRQIAPVAAKWIAPACSDKSASHSTLTPSIIDHDGTTLTIGTAQVACKMPALGACGSRCDVPLWFGTLGAFDKCPNWTAPSRASLCRLGWREIHLPWNARGGVMDDPLVRAAVEGGGPVRVEFGDCPLTVVVHRRSRSL